jgi:hypothetical protein
MRGMTPDRQQLLKPSGIMNGGSGQNIYFNPQKKEV